MHRINLVIFRLANKYLVDENFPIKSEQIPVLISVYQGRKMSQQEVADVINRDKSSVQRTISALQKKGLLKIATDKNDKRKNIVSTTSEGDLLSLRLKEVVKKVEGEIIKIFEKGEAVGKIRSVKAIADNLEQLIKQNTI